MGKIILGVIALALGVVWYVIWGIEMFRNIWIGIYPVLVPILLVVGAIAAGFIAAVFEKWFGWVVAVGLAGVFIWTCIVLPYDTAHNYASSVEIVETAPDEYAQRAPYEVAINSSHNNLQNTTGEAQTIKSLAAEGDNGEWNTLVVRRGFVVGYESVQVLDIPLFNQIRTSDVKFCEFDEDASLRFGGFLPSNNLGRTILAALPPNATYDESDAYAYCDGKTPMVVAPLKYLDGFYGATWKAYGLAVYNGTTGDFQIVQDEKKIAAYPGPVYPLSLAADTLNAYQAGGDYWSYVQNRFGYERATDNSEISLRKLNGEGVSYVSPLSPRGDSQNIVALAEVDNRTMAVNGRNKVVIHTYTNSDVRAANSTVYKTIKAEYSFLPDWASGMEIFEIVPTGKDEWVASIGQSQSVVYRAYITAEGDVTLFNAAGVEVTDGSKPDTGNGGEAPADGASLKDYTTEELRDLIDSAIDELESRTK